MSPKKLLNYLKITLLSWVILGCARLFLKTSVKQSFDRSFETALLWPIRSRQGIRFGQNIWLNTLRHNTERVTEHCKMSTSVCFFWDIFCPYSACNSKRFTYCLCSLTGGFCIGLFGTFLRSDVSRFTGIAAASSSSLMVAEDLDMKVVVFMPDTPSSVYRATSNPWTGWKATKKRKLFKNTLKFNEYF